MLTLVAIIILLLLFILAIYLILKRLFKNVNNKAKQYFNEKCQEYISNVNDKKSEENENEFKQKELKDIDAKESIIYIDNNNQYEIENLFDIIKKVDKKFDINYEEIIKYFVNKGKLTSDINRYKKLVSLKKYIDNIGIYNIITSEHGAYIDSIVDKIKTIDIDIYNKYFVYKSQFDIQEFTNYLDSEIEKDDPNIYVYVGEKGLNFDYLGENVKTIYSEKIYKGIQIVYRNNLYDYSLR